MRCRKRGAQVTFVAAAMPESIERRIKSVRTSTRPHPRFAGNGAARPRIGTSRHSANERRRPTSEATADGGGSVDWLIVDQYLLDCRWHSAARNFAEQILVIDDLANRQYDCDLLLDQTYGRSGGLPAARSAAAGVLRRPLTHCSAGIRARTAGGARAAAKSGGGATYPRLARHNRPAAESPRGRRASCSTAAPGCALDVVLGPDAPSLSAHPRDRAPAKRGHRPDRHGREWQS